MSLVKEAVGGRRSEFGIDWFCIAKAGSENSHMLYLGKALQFKAPDAMASRIQEIRKCLFQEAGGTACQEHQAYWGSAGQEP